MSIHRPAQEDTRASSRERVQEMMTLFDKNTNGKLDADERPALRVFLETSGALKGITEGFLPPILKWLQRLRAPGM